MAAVSTSPNNHPQPANTKKEVMKDVMEDPMKRVEHWTDTATTNTHPPLRQWKIQ